MKNNTILDSGERTEFPTGSVRDRRAGKGRYDLLPMWALDALAIHFENGSIKYGENNWRLGQPYSTYVDSAMRHLCKYARGEQDEPHLVAAAWNLMCLIETKNRVEAGLLDSKLANYPYDYDITSNK